MALSTKFKAVASVTGAAAVMMFTAAPAFAIGPGGGTEQILQPVPVPIGQLVGTVPYVATLDANGNPISSDLVIVGTGYNPLMTVYSMECDGKSPTSLGYSVANDCDPLTTVGAPGGVSPAADGEVQLGAIIFRGVGPNDWFNCLAPQDNPNGTTVNNPGNDSSPAAIDPTVPSWGATTVPVSGGGPAPCQERVTYNPGVLQVATDKYFPVEIPELGPPVMIPESPLAMALPIGATVLFAAAGTVIYRKRRSHPVAD